VVLGDSLASGYKLQPFEAFPAKLGDKLREMGYKNVDIIDMSNEDDTTTGAYRRFDAVLAKKPDIVVIMLGLNDVMSGIRPNMIYSNIAGMLSALRDKRIYTILVGVKAPAKAGDAYARHLDHNFEALAQAYAVPFYPNALEGISDKPQYTLADGIRPNAQGVDIMVEGLYRLVDYGLRWSLEVLKYQDEYRRQQGQPGAQ
jgi:acyl-CoA thioesterase-1